MVEINLEQIILVVASSLPAFASIIGCVVSFFKNVKSVNSIKSEMNALKTEVLNTKEYQDVKTQLAIAHAENVILKRKINELLTKIDKVVRYDNDEEANVL